MLQDYHMKPVQINSILVVQWIKFRIWGLPPCHPSRCMLWNILMYLILAYLFKSFTFFSNDFPWLSSLCWSESEGCWLNGRVSELRVGMRKPQTHIRSLIPLSVCLSHVSVCLTLSICWLLRTWRQSLPKRKPSYGNLSGLIFPCVFG